MIFFFKPPLSFAQTRREGTSSGMINASSLPSIDFDNVIIKPVQKAICQTSSGGEGEGGREGEREGREKTEAR